MSFFTRKKQQNSSDASLVMASLGGDRDAFCIIVARYQSLLCSVAYSSVGDVKHSEDIAQETFVEAWKKLETLQDPEKLKSWLCGILRFKVSRYRRKAASQPLEGAEDITEGEDHEAGQIGLEESAIREQEQALLWQTLEQIPANYREPLVLFYREHHSVAHVASALDLSEEVVKQRLSRGRKLLQKAMVTFVEDTLAKSAPSLAFTTSVIAAINLASPPVQAATLGAGAAKAGSLLKWTGLVTLLAAFSGVISAFFGVRAGLAQSRTQRERRSVIVLTSLFFIFAIIFVAGMFGFKHLAAQHIVSPTLLAVISQLWVLGFVFSYLWLTMYLLQKTRNLRAQERIFNPDAFTHPADSPSAKQREFKSNASLFGVHLFHFRFGTPEKNDGPVVGWVAGGDRAYGLLFAWGGIAVAPISVGIVAVGGLSIGAVGIGVLGIGTVGIGFVGFGAAALGYKAYASMSAMGWESAFSGGFSIAKDAAIGSYAFAQQVNNEQAADIVQLALFGQGYLWLLGTIAALVIVPAAWHSREVRRRMKR